MKTITAGQQLVQLVVLCFQAEVPLMLLGRHGLGKSEILAQAASLLSIDMITRDLSLMEPVDLCGLPKIGANDRTHVMPPAFLPDTGRGLLLFEEINRAPRYMQSPCPGLPFVGSSC